MNPDVVRKLAVEQTDGIPNVMKLVLMTDVELPPFGYQDFDIDEKEAEEWLITNCSRSLFTKQSDRNVVISELSDGRSEASSPIKLRMWNPSGALMHMKRDTVVGVLLHLDANLTSI